jgi:hypothetical protein
MSFSFRLALVALLSATAAARANDSSAHLDTGGLTLARDDVIEMDSEDLFISKSQIRVRYRFVNPTAQARTIMVAFPMPDLDVSGPEENVAVPTEDASNFLDFHTRANGVAVAAEVEQKAIAKGVERTQLLRAWGVPLNPHLRETGAALDRLSPERKAQALTEGFADKEEYDAGKGWETHLGPRWTLKTNWFWRQTFAPGETIIEHVYKPSVGGSTGTAIAGPDWKGDDAASMTRRYCLDHDFVAMIDRRRREAKAEYAPLAEDRIGYVLKSGANWAKPIRDFRLVVDKGSPENLVSLCAPGIVKISPTQFEWRRANFTPQADLQILILKKAGTD